MPSIKHYFAIMAPVERVFAAVTEQEGLASWWTRETVAEPRVGAINEFTFGERWHNKMKVTALEPNRRVEWECIEAAQEWVGTTITFDLEPRDDGATLVRFGHNDWAEQTDFFADCNYNWGYYMRSLKQYVETGAGTPFE